MVVKRGVLVLSACIQARGQQWFSTKDKLKGTFESRLFRSRMGLCRKMICLVDKLPSLQQKEDRKDRVMVQMSLPHANILIQSLQRVMSYTIRRSLRKEEIAGWILM